MNKKITNVLLVGLGSHAKRIYFPVFLRDGEKYNFRIVCALDLKEKKDDIENYLSEKGNPNLEMHYFLSKDFKSNRLRSPIKKKLDEIIDKFSIQGVIISTGPESHMVYVQWALEKGLSVLMDKPLSVHNNLSTSKFSAKKLIDDYEKIIKVYEKAKKKYGRILFSLVVQRRYHPAFEKIRNLIKEVFNETNCPITSIQAFHSDGQWRLPNEIMDVDYHSFNHGYGKCSHSGYHFFDIIIWLMKAAEEKGKKVNNVDVFSNFVRPSDFLSQIEKKDYEKIFPNFNSYNKYNFEKLKKSYKRFGEIDSFCSFAFKRGGDIITLASVNLVHNGFSKRGWLSLAGKDLYKGNGPIRHESYIIEQGPFQAIHFNSFQSGEVNPNITNNLYEVGNEYHLDIHVFRNDNYFSGWKNYEKFSIKELGKNYLHGRSRGHQEDARREAILEFISFLQGNEIDPVSEITSHENGISLCGAVYQSASKRYKGRNPLVNVKLF